MVIIVVSVINETTKAGIAIAGDMDIWCVVYCHVLLISPFHFLKYFVVIVICSFEGKWKMPLISISTFGFDFFLKLLFAFEFRICNYSFYQELHFPVHPLCNVYNLQIPSGQ